MRARPFVLHLFFRESVANTGGNRREAIANGAGCSANGTGVNLRHTGIGAVVNSRDHQIRRRVFQHAPQAEIQRVGRRSREAVAFVSGFFDIKDLTRLKGDCRPDPALIRCRRHHPDVISFGRQFFLQRCGSHRLAAIVVNQQYFQRFFSSLYASGR